MRNLFFLLLLLSDEVNSKRVTYKTTLYTRWILTENISRKGCSKQGFLGKNVEEEEILASLFGLVFLPLF